MENREDNSQVAVRHYPRACVSISVIDIEPEATRLSVRSRPGAGPSGGAPIT